jgi:hypothetical protein
MDYCWSIVCFGVGKAIVLIAVFFSSPNKMYSWSKKAQFIPFKMFDVL